MPDLLGIYALLRMVGDCAGNYIAVQQAEATSDICRGFDLRRRHIMVAVTYGVPNVPAARAAERALAEPRKSLFARFMDALVESRLQAVHREIARHAHLLPRTFDEQGNRLA